MRKPEKKKSVTAEVPDFKASHILVHYDEVALKGRNRRRFESRLARNVRRALPAKDGLEVQRIWGRLLVSLGPDADVDRCCRYLARVFGVSRFSPVMQVAGDLNAVKELLGRLVAGLPSRTFAIVSHRANKQLPFTSADANRVLGAHVQSVTDWPVRLDDPELAIHVYFVGQDTYLAFARLPGPGGLPSGSTGKVACLLSGGIDSPVAVHRMLRRGVEPIFVHFHSAPHTSAASQDKARELASRVLARGQAARLYIVPFAPLQQRITTECHPPYRVILYRRFMMRVAEAIARLEGAGALVTGESLGQVASQTLENLHTIDRAVEMPILRPLVGMSKLEIVDDAKRIGTFETSIEPHDDCCSFLMPRNPATYSSPEELEAAEAVFDIAREVGWMVEASTKEEIVGTED